MMARTTVWMAMVDKPGSGEVPDGGETALSAFTSATAAKRGAVSFAKSLQLVNAGRSRFPWRLERPGKWVAEFEQDGDEILLGAIEVDLLTARDVLDR